MPDAGGKGERHSGGGHWPEAGVKGESKAKLPAGAKVSWISTRKAAAAADHIAGNLLNSFVLHEMVTNVKAPLHELSTAHLVVLEVPPVSAPKFEHDFLALVQKIRR